jgi:hypothetical protein
MCWRCVAALESINESFPSVFNQQGASDLAHDEAETVDAGGESTNEPFFFLFQRCEMLAAVGLASTLLSSIAAATTHSVSSSFYESPHKIFNSIRIDGHSALVSSLEKSSMKVTPPPVH